MKGIIEPYPSKWPRMLDFITPLTLQVAIDPSLDMYHYEGVVSVPADVTLPSKQSKTTELGTMISTVPNASNKIKVDFGRVSPNVDDVRSQKEIINDIKDNVPVEIPDVVTKMRGSVEKIPKECEKIEALQGSEYVFHEQIDKGNFTQRLREIFPDMPLRNPHEFMKGDLLTQGIINNLKDPLLRRMRGILKTNWVITDDQGYFELGENVFELLKGMCRNKWWQDIGMVKEFSVDLPENVFKGQLYWLTKREWLIGV